MDDPATATATLHIEIAERPDPVREAAAYYLVAEAVTNLQKHAGADHIAVDVHQDKDRLCVVVEDDGNGGAELEPGGGLVGLTARIHSLDGTYSPLRARREARPESEG